MRAHKRRERSSSLRGTPLSDTGVDVDCPLAARLLFFAVQESRRAGELGPDRGVLSARWVWPQWCCVDQLEFMEWAPFSWAEWGEPCPEREKGATRQYAVTFDTCTPDCALGQFRSCEKAERYSVVRLWRM